MREGRGEGTGDGELGKAGFIGRRWRRSDYSGAADAIAPRLVGRILVRRLDDGTVLAGRIVETEAYLGAIDAASHAFGGRRTARNESLYARPGTAYVYFTYGMHFCFNVVCGTVDDPQAVLVRALEPMLGIEQMRRNRGARRNGPTREIELCSGPARLCQALAIDRGLDGADMVREPRVFVAEPGAGLEAIRGSVVRTPRIGVEYAGAWARRALRFVVRDHPHASPRRVRRAKPKV